MADDLWEAMRAGALAAIRRACARQAQKAIDGTTTPENFPEVLVRSGEAAITARMADALAQMAVDVEGMEL